LPTDFQELSFTSPQAAPRMANHLTALLLFYADGCLKRAVK